VDEKKRKRDKRTIKERDGDAEQSRERREMTG
jgi:hypothetical protein